MPGLLQIANQVINKPNLAPRITHKDILTHKNLLVGEIMTMITKNETHFNRFRFYLENQADLPYQVPQYSMENSSIALIIDFHFGIQKSNGFELNDRAICFLGFYSDNFLGGYGVQAFD